MGALGDKFRRLAILLEPEVERMAAKQAAHIGDFDDAQFDAAQEIATFWRGPEPVWRCHAEPIGRLNAEFGLFRWWWHGRSAHAKKSRLDTVVKEGYGYQIGELTTDHVEVANEDEAHLLSRVAAQIARADGVLRVEDEYGTSFIALFEGGPAPASLRKLSKRDEAASQIGGSVRPSARPSASPTVPQSVGGETELDGAEPLRVEPLRDPRFSIPVPSVEAMASASRGTAQSVHTIPPTPLAFQITSLSALSEPPPIHIPARDVVGPLVSAALAHVTNELRGEFQQALLVVVVELADLSSQRAKGRFFVHIVASDASGELLSLDATDDLVATAQKMIATDAQSGNGRWRKLLVRLRRTPRGASVEVDVRA